MAGMSCSSRPALMAEARPQSAQRNFFLTDTHIKNLRFLLCKFEWLVKGQAHLSWDDRLAVGQVLANETSVGLLGLGRH